MSRFTVATINLRNRADRWTARRSLLVAQLLDTLPDAVCLQEVSFPVRQGKWLRTQLNARLGQLPGRGGYELVERRKSHPIHGYYEGIGIHSRLPIIATDWLSLGYGGRVALRANLELPTGRTIDLVCTHLHHQATHHEARLEQVMWLTGWLNDTSRVPHQVIAGDFNELPNGPAIRQIKQVYRSAYQVVHGHEPLATFPTALAGPGDWAGCLDYIFISPAVQAVAARIFLNRPGPNDNTLYPSDHVGLLATLQVED